MAGQLAGAGAAMRIGWLGSGGVARAHFDLLRQVPRARLVSLNDALQWEHDPARAAVDWREPTWRIPDAWWESVDAPLSDR